MEKSASFAYEYSSAYFYIQALINYQNIALSPKTRPFLLLIVIFQWVGLVRPRTRPAHHYLTRKLKLTVNEDKSGSPKATGSAFSASSSREPASFGPTRRIGNSSCPFLRISSMKLTEGKTILPKRLHPVMCVTVPRAIP